MTLGYSRKSVRLLVWRSSAQVWTELHEQAFRRLGGTVRVVVLDNLREGVLKPDIYDPTLNPLYRDVLAHYGVMALPCRVRDPDRKGKVESSIGHAQRTPLKGLRLRAWKRRSATDWWRARRTPDPRNDEVQVGDACRGEARPGAALEPSATTAWERTQHLDGQLRSRRPTTGPPC
jgi:transposase